MYLQKLLVLFIITSFFSCQKDDQSAHQPIKIIFDTDMGSDCDDVGALALLHAYADEGKADIVGCVYSSGRVPYGAAIIQAINNYYGRPEIPVGAYHGDDLGDPVDKMNAKKLAQETGRFGHSIIHNHDAPDQTKLTRQVLVEQPDNSVTYVTVGHTKGLYDLLLSEPDTISPLTGDELVKQKINRWIALGALGANNNDGHYVQDWNFFRNDTAPFTTYLVENYPVPSYFIHAGHNVLTGKSLASTPPGNIVRTAYEEWLAKVFQKTLADQRSSWDLAAVYFAVEGLGDYLQVEENGWLEFDLEKGSKWNVGENDVDHTFIYQKENTDSSFADYLNEMIARAPKLKK